MKKNELFFPSKDKKTNIHMVIWEPDNEVLGVIEVVHGVTEHIMRYEEMAYYFTNRGIRKGVKPFFEQEKQEVPKLPNKSITLIIAAIVSVMISNNLLEKGYYFNVNLPTYEEDLGIKITKVVDKVLETYYPGEEDEDAVDVITESRKSAFVDTADGYIKAVMIKVNEAGDLKFFDTNTLYLVPVGHEEGKSCSPLEAGGDSPFHDEWKYAYVGVTYSGRGYTYYFTAEDGSNRGINMIEQNALVRAGGDAVVTDIDSVLEDYYGKSSKAGLYITSNCTDPSSCIGRKIDDEVISVDGDELDVKYVAVIDPSTCKYSG